MKFAGAVHTKFANFLPRGRARPPLRAGMDRLDAEADVDSEDTHCAKQNGSTPLA
jgi:hypothetical protein